MIARLVIVTDLTKPVQLLIKHNSLFGLFYHHGIIYATDMWNDVQPAVGVETLTPEPVSDPTAL